MLIVADEARDFGDYLLGRTALPRPVFGTAGIVSQVEMPTAPLRPWRDLALSFPTLEDATEFGLTMALADGVDVKNVHPAADVTNPEVEGAYQGMRLLVQALTQLGASPTRAGLKQVLDSTTLDTGLAPAAKFSAGNHFASIGI